MAALFCAPAQPQPLWGPAVNHVRSQLSLSADRRVLELTYENTGERTCYLLLGRIGTAYPEGVRFTATDGRGGERNLALRQAGSAVAPSRPSPLVVPLLPGSRYTARVPLTALGANAAGRTLRAHLLVMPSDTRPFVAQFGLDIFWTGKLVSNAIAIPGSP